MLKDCHPGSAGAAGLPLLERVINTTPIPIAVVEGPEFRYVLVNRAYCAIEARTEAFFLGRTMAQIFPEGAQYDARVAVLREVYQVGHCISQKELELCLRKGREQTWWNIEYVPLRGEAGQVFAVLIMAQDVTEQVAARRQAEGQAAVLRENEARLSQLATVVEGASDFVGIADLDGHALYVNPAGQTMVGLAGDEAVRATLIEDYLFPEDLPFVRETVLPTVLREGRWKSEFCLRHFQTGEPIPVLWDVFRVDDPRTGQPIKLATIIRDIRPQKAAEQALRESEATLRGFFNANAVYMSILELDGDDIVYMDSNPRMAAFFGLSVDELAGKHGRQLGLPEEFIATGVATIRQCHQTQQPISGEYQVPYQDSKGWYYDTVSPLPAGNSGRPRCALVAVDITDRRLFEERLKTLNENLEQQVVERTAMAEQRAAQLRVLAAELTRAEEQERRRLAKVLHDHLQQLLVAARMKVAVLRRRAEEERLTRTLEQIDDVLNQAISESRSLTVNLSPPVLYDAGLAAGLEWLARQMEEKHGTRVIVNVDPEAEPTEEDTRVFLFQAVRELLLNVVKHAQADMAHVELLPLDNQRLQLVVADRGVGFASTASVGQGMPGGFGLFSIRERLELLGGQLNVETGPRQGTRVVIELPRGRLTSAAAPMGTMEGAALPFHAREEGIRPDRSEKVRVMLADDHAIVRQGLAGLLRDQGAIEVVGEAADGRQAVEIAMETRPDVVLMDVTMPDLNGIEATRRILAALPATRVIGLSMHEAADMATAMHKAGAIAYLRKDTDTDVLVSTILSPPRSGRPQTRDSSS